MKPLFVAIFFSIAEISFGQAPEPTGDLVDIGGYRLHIDIEGKGGPPVIFISGSQAFSFDWSLVTPYIATITQTVTYDRPALAWSDPGPMPRSFDQDVYELHELLQRATVRPPYILVGHSLGGILARKFEMKYPHDVKGMLLIDATSENTVLFINGKVQRLRDISQRRQVPAIKVHTDTLTKVPTQKEMDDFLKMVGEPKIDFPFNKLPQKFQRARMWAMKQPKFLIADNGGYWAEEFEAMYNDSAYSLGSKPLVVLTSAQNNYPKELGDSLRKDLIQRKLRDQRKMAALSSNNKLVVTTKSPHEIHISEPELVIKAIRNVIESVRTGKPL